MNAMVKVAALLRQVVNNPLQWEQNPLPQEVDECGFASVEMSGDTGYVVFTTGSGTIDG